MDLEPDLTSLRDGTEIDVVVRAEFLSAGFHVVTTSIHKTVAFTDVAIPQGSLVTLFNTKKHVIGGRIWLLRTESTTVLKHTVKGMEQFAASIEVCAGIGASATGYKACGVETTCFNEQNPVFAHWLRSRGKTVIEGDVSDPKVVAALSEFQAGLLSGGISCQPWSSLGDRKELQDDRSRTLPGTLRAIHLLQMPLSILECTPAVLQSSEAQAMIKKFC